MFQQCSTSCRFATSVLGLKPGQTAVVANGLIVGPLNEDETLVEEDISLLEKMLLSRGSSVNFTFFLL